MCVAVTLMPGSKLSIDEIVKMDRNNADGVGIAWADEGIVSWQKTIMVNPEMVEKLVNYWVGVPRLIHFRLSTAGGTKAELCHPFEVGPRANCAISGTGQTVMIHNGHWWRWNEVAKILGDEDLLPDKGPWSDSRLGAFMAHLNPEWLIALGGKVATLTGKGDITRLGTWEELREGIWVSNKSWESASSRRGGYSGYKHWQGWGEDEPSTQKSKKKEKDNVDGAHGSGGKGGGGHGKNTGVGSGKGGHLVKSGVDQVNSTTQPGSLIQGSVTNHSKGNINGWEAWTDKASGQSFEYNRQSGIMVRVLPDGTKISVNPNSGGK